MTADLSDGELLFKSHRADNKEEWIDRNTALNWIKEACRRAGFSGNVGCHTLRKTYGYHFYRETRDLAALMIHFNHSSEQITKRYIGITQEEVNRLTVRFRL